MLRAPELLFFTLTPPLACHRPPSLSLNSATPGPIAQPLWRLLLQRWACQRASDCVFMSLIMVELLGVLVIRVLPTVIPARGATLSGRWLCSPKILGAAHPSPLTCSNLFFWASAITHPSDISNWIIFLPIHSISVLFFLPVVGKWSRSNCEGLGPPQSSSTEVLMAAGDEAGEVAHCRFIRVHI